MAHIAIAGNPTPNTTFPVNGTAEADEFTLIQPTSPGTVVISGGAGIDVYDYSTSFPAGVTVSRNDIIQSIEAGERVYLSGPEDQYLNDNGDVTIVKGKLTLTLTGVDSKEVIKPSNGSPYFLQFGRAATEGLNWTGTDGADTQQGTSSHDTMTAGLGNDYAQGLDGDDVLSGNLGDDTLFGNAGNDTLFGGQGNDSLYGGQGTDIVYGNAGNDAVYGNMGADTLFGGAGNDTLFGGQGDDRLFGNLGDDRLLGNVGNDTMTGGGGADTFVFASGAGSDTITDMNAAEGDHISLAAGLTWTVTADSSGNAVLTLSSGDHVTLAGVAASAVNAGWFV